MKKMFFAIAFALGTMGITNAQEINGKFMAEFSKLNTYLGLQSTQLNEVYEINSYFKEAQMDIKTRGNKSHEEQMKEALLVNMKLMKDALNEEQYRKYVTLLNITNNNNKILKEMPLTDIYMADNH